MVNLTKYRKLQELKARSEQIEAEVDALFKEKFATIEEAKRVALERARVMAGIGEDLDEQLEAERAALFQVALENLSATGKKTLQAEGGAVTVTERDKCDVIKSDDWADQVMSYTEAVYADVRTLYEADALEFLKINTTAALAKALPGLKAKGHGELYTVVPVKTQSVTIKLDK